MDREDTPEPITQSPALGYLRYVDRKTGEVKQRLPLDAERITFGRDPDCDIRLHWEDVSRVHAEIQFNLIDGTATLEVLGSNGIYFAAANQSRVKLDPPSRQLLSAGDSFIIRRKLFIFEYPARSTFSSPALSPTILNTPVRGKGTPLRPTTTSTPLRRRASHRLSLMPADIPFVPLSPMKRRQSNADQTGRTPKRSHLANAVEEDEEDEILEGIVDVQQNEDGDLIILEMREETPQLVETPIVVAPKTPRSIPLPLPAQTPYAQTPQRVPAKVAMSTPPGPMTLHKILLLRSARKAWVESAPKDADEAVADGMIEIGRRKSRSPLKDEGGGGRKSLTPRPSVSHPDSDISDDEEFEAEEEEEAIATGRAELQWVQVDPLAEASFVESDSADDSIEADYSLEIPGQGVLDFGPLNGEELSADEEEESYENEDDEESFDSQKENRFDEYDQEEIMSDDGEAEQEGHLESATQNTPVTSRTLDRFYTPQVPRAQNQARRSLASIGGPASRAFGVSASPNPLAGGAVRSTPSRPTVNTLPSSYEVDEDEDEGVEDDVKPIQISVSERELAEIKKRRQSLATPRQLPAAPMSFRDPIKGPFSLVKTPSHPALTRSPTKATEQHDDTPIGDIRSRLDKMRRDSSARELSRPSGRDGRRATVGFALPETPHRPTIQASASYTAAPAARFGIVAPPILTTPVVRPCEDESDISSFQPTPLRSAIKKASTPFSLIRHAPIQESPEANGVEDSPIATRPVEYERTVQVATPVRPVRQAAARPEPKTPYMGDIRNLYPTIPDPASPILSGIKNLYPSLPLPPKTPDLRGMKGMFAGAGRNVVATPGMEGLEEMFASPVRVAPAVIEQIRGDEMEEMANVASPRVSRQSSVEAQVQPIAAAELDQTARQLPVLAISTQQAGPIDVGTKQSKPSARAPRSVQPTNIPAPSIKSAPTRSRAPQPIEKSAAVEAVPTSTRRRAAAPSAIPVAATETRSKPTRRTAVPAADSAPAAIEEVITASKPTRSRATSTKVPITAPTIRPVSPQAKSAPAQRGRSKKVLAETAEQLVPEPAKSAPPATAVSKPARTRTAAAVSVPVPVVPAPEKKTVSAPTRRTRAVKEDAEGEKENVDEQEKSAPSRVSRARSAKKEVAVVVPEPAVSVSRATRSRK